MSNEFIPSWSLLYYISEWLVRLVMLGLVIERHPPRAAMTWLLVIFFLPWPGLLLYLFIGENRLPHRRLMKRKALLTRLEVVHRRYMPHRENISSMVDQEFLPTVILAERLGYMPIMSGNKATLLAETETVIERLVEDIDAAQDHVHLLVYIFAVDETGQRIIAALERAVSRGVECRLLVDAQGSRQFLKKLSRRLIATGVKLYPALPVSLLRAWVSRIDLRNHRKILVIDGRVAYTGSQNIVNAGYGRRNLQWYDLMVRLTGPVVLELQAVFVGDWFAESDELLDGADIFPDGNCPVKGGVAVQTLPSGPLFSTENYQRLAVAALHATRRKVTITTPYFVPDEVFLEAMETVALRGVVVELIVPLHSDQILVGNAARGYYERLLKSGVTIYLFNKGLLHAKSMTIDNSLAFLGSSNFDIRSFALNFEINMIIYDDEFAASLRRQQNWYRKHSDRLLLAQWQQRPCYQRIMQNIIKLLSPLL
ncbi:MAG: cardiolipin synthase [Gammaproteobacteria bacterium]|nr:cardiolipin synthase [Gammaproteobacteria bacterium]